VRSPGNSQSSALSPDGRWLAYSSAASGRLEVYVQAFGAGTARSQVSTSGGLEPHWSRDGRALYYRQSTQLVMVPVEAGAAFLPGKPTVLLSNVLAPLVDSAETYDIGSGDRFVMMKPSEEQG
jgi:Tol biopolymer transport system component